MRFPASLVGSRLHEWSLKIKELTYNGKWPEVFFHYHELKKTGAELTDPSVLPCILKASSNISFNHGRLIHCCLIKQGFGYFTSAGNALMDFYMKWRHPVSAMAVFDSIGSKDSVSWNIVIHGYLNMGSLEDGLWRFNQGRFFGFEPIISVIVLVIQACRNLRAYYEGIKIHGYVIQTGFCSVHSVQNSLLSMYLEGDMRSACQLFDEMRERDVISWNVMIAGYARNEKASFALQLFREMVSDTRVDPDGTIFVSVLKACASLGDLSLGKVIHGSVIHRDFIHDLFVVNSMIDMYSKCKDVDSAFRVFNKMPQKNNVSWNSMLSGFVLNEKHSEALSLFHSMRKDEIEVDEVTLGNVLQISKYFYNLVHCKSIHCIILRKAYESNELLVNSLVDAYAKCYLVYFSWKVFKSMKNRDVVSWSTMISGFSHCGMPNEAVGVFAEMVQGETKPNAVTVINLLEACSLTAELQKSKWGHGIAIRRGLAAEVAVGTSIVDMYSKCGDIESSKKVFKQISRKNIVSWSAMVAAYGMNGLGNEALALVSEMKTNGLDPNAVTTLSVLSACSHCGLVEEGLSFFKSTLENDGVEPVLEHYSCLVDMLSRAGKLDDAMELIKKMPENMKVGASAWGAFLSACRSYGNRELGVGAVSRVIELEPLKSAGYLMGSSVYAEAGLWVDAAKMRRLVKERGVTIVAGYSLVHVDNRVIRFVAGEKSYHQSREINVIVENLHGCMKIDESNELDILKQF